MSTEQLDRVHRRYIRISNAFKSSWTFHQFIQGVQKVFSSLEAPDYPSDFQSVYNELKQVSKNLSETTVETANSQLDQVEQKLSPLTQSLLAVDEQISPALLRLFFQRVKNYDDNILTQLVKFYLYSGDGEGWNLDRLDKADYLSTKVVEEYHDSRDAFVLRDPTHVREVAQGFWATLGGRIEPPGETTLAELQGQIRDLGERITSTSSIDELHGEKLIPEYRDLKHELGDLFFQPKVLQAILETNLGLKNHIHRLYRREEQRIVAEYQQVFELERDVPVDVKLREELSDFRAAVERFEKQLQGENLRLDELAQLREQVRDLTAKLRPEEVGDEPLVRPPEARELFQDPGEAAESPVEVPDDDYVQEQYEAIVAALDDTNPTADPRKVALQPEVFSFGLGVREIVAYRRLFGGAKCDRELERFVLRSAALRCRIEQEVEGIKGILDDTAVTRDAPIFAQARSTLRRGDLYLREFEHLLEIKVLEGDVQEAQALQVLKMRMMRAYSGLWLMVYRN